MNNKFNAEQAQLQRDWQEKMWNKNNEYNSPRAMISRGLNPFIGSNIGAGVSRSVAGSGAQAQSAGLPSLQAFRPDFSDVGSALASMAQARASMINAESNAALTPYKMQQILGATDYRNIGVGQSGCIASISLIRFIALSLNSCSAIFPSYRDWETDRKSVV